MIGDDTTATLLSVLEQERDAIDELHYRLVALHRLVEAGELELLDRASLELDGALVAVRELELVRGVIVGGLADEGVDRPATLTDLLDLVEPSARARVREIGDHLARRVEEIERIGARTERRADRAADDLETWGALVGTVER